MINRATHIYSSLVARYPTRGSRGGCIGIFIFYVEHSAARRRCPEYVTMWATYRILYHTPVHPVPDPRAVPKTEIREFRPRVRTAVGRRGWRKIIRKYIHHDVLFKHFPGSGTKRKRKTRRNRNGSDLNLWEIANTECNAIRTAISKTNIACRGGASLPEFYPVVFAVNVFIVFAPLPLLRGRKRIRTTTTGRSRFPRIFDKKPTDFSF